MSFTTSHTVLTSPYIASSGISVNSVGTNKASIKVEEMHITEQDRKTLTLTYDDVLELKTLLEFIRDKGLGQDYEMYKMNNILKGE